MNPTLIELGKRFKEIKDAHDRIKAALDDASAEWDRVEAELKSAMLEDCVNSVDIEGVGKLSLVRKSYLSVNAANKPEFYKYLQESGNGDLLKLDVNPRTLTAFLKTHKDDLTKQFMVIDNLDKIDAEEKAEMLLKEKGASHFAEVSISLRKS